MGKHAKMNFHSLRSAGTSTQHIAQTTLESRDDAFGLGALAVLELWKTPVHLATILGLGPATSAPFVQVDDRAIRVERALNLAPVSFVVLRMPSCSRAYA